MAKVGGGAAYQQLRNHKDDISANARHAASIAAGHVRQLRGINEGKRKEKQNKIKEWENKYKLKEGDFQNKSTGFGSYDDIHRDYAQFTTEKYVDLSRQAREASERGDLKEKTRLEGELIKRKNNFALVMQGQEALAGIKEKYMEAIQEGRVSGASKNFEENMQAGILDFNVAIREDDRGNPIYVGLRTNEETGEKEPFEIPHGDIIDETFSWVERQNIKGKDGLVPEVLDGLGSVTTKTSIGLQKLTEQKWDEELHGKTVDQAIDTYTSNDSVMADLLYQFSSGEVIKTGDFTEEDYNLVKEKFRNQVRAGYSEKFEKEFDTARARLGLDNRKFKASKEKQEEVIQAEPMTEASGELLGGLPVPSTGDASTEQSGGRYTLKTKGGKPIKGVLSGDSESEILSITKSGNSYFVDTRRTEQVTSKDVLTGESKKTPRTTTNSVELTKEELNRLSRRMGLSTAGDLDNYLEKRTEDYKQRTGNTGDSDDPLGILK